MEILVPIYWLSDSLVEGHHKQAGHFAYHLSWALFGFLCEVHRASKPALRSAI